MSLLKSAYIALARATIKARGVSEISIGDKIGKDNVIIEQTVLPNGQRIIKTMFRSTV